MAAMLCVAQTIGATTPARGADLHREATSTTTGTRTGAFAGARLRLPLGPARTERLRAGLTVAPMVEARQSDGSVRTRFGEGLELGVSGDETVGLSFAPLARAKAGPRGRKAGVSSLGWVGIGVGAVLVVVASAYVLCFSGAVCNFDDE
jgi:hypothetical protein